MRVGSPNQGKGLGPGQVSIGRIVPFPWEHEEKTPDGPLLPGRVLVGRVSGVYHDRVEVSLGSLSGEIALRDMAWARRPDTKRDGRYTRITHPSDALKIGDIIEVKVLPPRGNHPREAGKLRLSLEQEPEVQASLLALDPATGQIKAMIGGYDYHGSQFNRAIQARRQPGSAFKPIIYTAALERGYTPATIVLDSPVIYKEQQENKFQWKPANFEEKFYGPTRIRSAVAHSRNLVTIKVLKDIGIRNVIQCARRLGIQSPLTQDLSLALGSSGLTLLELTSAYSIFANQGVRVKPYAIRSIKNRNGVTIEEHSAEEKEQVVAPGIAYSITSILKSVVQEGTGRRVARLGRPVAGKTGTTNNYIDAWFIGFTTDLVTGVWVGLDDNKPLGRRETGARAAAPIWLDFMKEAERGKPVSDFPIPPEITFKRIDRKTGLLAPFGQASFFECFLADKAPVQYARPEGAPGNLLGRKPAL